MYQLLAKDVKMKDDPKNATRNLENVQRCSQTEASKNFIDRAGFEDFLNEKGIKYVVRDHPEVFTVEAMMKYVSDMEGLHMKNLFLKDKKKNLYLLAARHDAKV